MWRHAGSYQPGRGKVSTWIASIAHHRTIDLVRQRKRDAVMLAQAAAEAGSLPRTWDGPELRAERNWERQQVRDALETLPPEQREVLLLAYFKGLTHVEIAEALGQPLGTVKTRIRLAVQKLRDRLQSDLKEVK